MATFVGNRITSSVLADTDYVWPDGRMLAIDFGSLMYPPSNGWITRIGGWVRQTSGLTLPSRVEWGIFERLPNGLPGRMIARTDLLAVPNSPSLGANVEGPLTWISDEFRLGGKITAPMALRVTQGQQFLIGSLTDYYVSYVSKSTAAQSTFQRPEPATHLINSFGTPTAPAPFGSHKRYSLYYVFEDSTPPTIALTSPASGATINDSTPTFTGTFTDANAAAFGDTFFRYEIEVRRQSTGAILWTAALSQSLTNAAEIASKTFSKLYTGSTLPAGVTLEWRARVQDFSGEWSAFSSWSTFTLASEGVIDTDTTKIPTGHVDGNAALIDWSARWWHTANLAANAVQVRVKDASGAVIRNGAEVVKTVAAAMTPPGTQFTIQDTEVGFPTPLPQGAALTWEMRGRDTNNLWSPWSAGVAFRTNAVPTVPQPVSPASGSVHTSPPFLIATSQDIDPEDAPLSGVVWDVDVTEIATGTVRSGLATDYDATTKQVKRLADAALAPSFGQYSWRMRGRDVSAGSFGISAYGPSRTFTLSDGPVVTVTAPTEGEIRETTALRVQWATSEAQTTYLVQLWLVNANGTLGEQRHSSGITSSAVKFYDIPVGVLQNNTNYALKVTATNSINQTGTSQERRFRVFFTGAQALASLVGSVVARLGDVEPTTPRLTWSATTYSATEHLAYIVKRWETAKGESTAVTLVEITNHNQKIFDDYHAPPNVALTYGVSQRIQAGVNMLTSPDVNVALSFDLTVPLAVSRQDPANVRFPFMWLNTDYGGTVEPIQAEYTTWEASGLPTIVGANGGPETRQIGITLRTDQYGSMISKFHRIKNAVKTNHQISLRDESERLFMAMKRMRWKRGRVVGTRTIQIELRETSFRERA